jgi:hypothetical protein
VAVPSLALRARKGSKKTRSSAFGAEVPSLALRARKRGDGGVDPRSKIRDLRLEGI